ncbi:MAG: hypothetical protein BroJett029_24110 [Alphaproteobacteria bacterium]|nr:MAG: hypothetical protein BroJett029_24110 [Alphaproteobacteria bacterium]
MGGFDLFGDDDTGTVFRDTIMLALAGFVAIVILVLPFINPEAKQSEDADRAPGNVVVEIQWQDGLDADVDLWVQAPGDTPVGYSNKGGESFNLLRDDLGKISDVTDLNYEIAYSRGIPAGEYTVNVHMYRAGRTQFPLPVKIVASVKSSPEESTRQLLTTTVTLTRENEEITAFRFRLDEKGNLARGSVHSLQKPLRAAGAA